MSKSAAGRLPEIGVAAERRDLGACDSGETKSPILRVRENEARAIECLGVVAFEPEELSSEIQTARKSG